MTTCDVLQRFGQIRWDTARSCWIKYLITKKSESELVGGPAENLLAVLMIILVALLSEPAGDQKHPLIADSEGYVQMEACFSLPFRWARELPENHNGTSPQRISRTIQKS